jgi:flagellar hook protein FlgE
MTSFSSIFGTGISGMNAYGTQLQNISSNIANLQTIGFKVTDTHFNDNNVAQNTLTLQNGIVQAKAVNRNGSQGGIEASKSISNLAVNGPGYFSVLTPFVTINADGTTTPAFAGATPQFTRKGDFLPDNNGYLVNSDGNYLQGVALTAGTGAVATNALTPIQIPSTATSAAKATSNINGTLNFPASAADGATLTQSASIYDSTGAQQSIPLVWTKQAGGGNVWTVSAGQLPSGIASVTPTNGTLTFNSDGSLAPGSAGSTAGSAVSIGLSVAYAAGSTATSPQAVNFNLGTAASGTDITAAGYVSGTGTTQFYAGTTDLQINQLNVDGNAEGAATGFTIDNQGVVSQTFSNGLSNPIYRVPLTTFPNPEGLDRISGTLFTQVDTRSGVGSRNWAGDGGTGRISPQSVETSTADPTIEFTNMIQAQRAYSANSKSITTADQMMTTVIGLKS